MTFVPQRKDIRNLVLSANKQTAYGTAVPDANLLYRPQLDASAFPARTPAVFTDLDFANKGHDWATQRQVTEWASAFSFAGPLDDYMAGWLAAFGLGADTITGGPAPFTHTCKFLQSSKIMPVTTLYTEDTADLLRRWPDMAVASVKISGGANGPLQYSVALAGSGKFTAGAIAALPAVPTRTMIMGSDTEIKIGPQGAPVSVKERLRGGWSVEIANALEAHRAPGGGLYPTMCKIAAQRLRFSLQVDAKDADDIMTLLDNTTIQELQINTNSGAAAQLNIQFPGVYLAGDSLGLGGAWVIHNVAGDEASIIKSGANEPIVMVAINSQATYLVGA